jgi:hypothetical protein
MTGAALALAATSATANNKTLKPDSYDNQGAYSSLCLLATVLIEAQDRVRGIVDQHTPPPG